MENGENAGPWYFCGNPDGTYRPRKLVARLETMRLPFGNVLTQHRRAAIGIAFPELLE